MIAKWISYLDGKKPWEEVKAFADLIFHPEYVLMKGEQEVPYGMVMASLEKMLVSGVIARLVKVRKVDDGIEGTWDSFYTDGRRVRLQSVWSFSDGKIVMSQHVRRRGSITSGSTPRKTLSFEKELSALTESDCSLTEPESSVSSSDENDSSSLSDDGDMDLVGELTDLESSPRSLFRRPSFKRVSSAKKALQSQHRKNKELRQVGGSSSSNIVIKS